MQHSCMIHHCLGQHTVVNQCKDYSQHKDSDRYHQCKQAGRDNLCQLCILVLQRQQLKRHANWESKFHRLPIFEKLTLNTRNMAISYQRISAGANLSVVSGTTFSTLNTVAWSAKRLTFLSSKTTARNKVTYFSGSTIRITSAACLNACNKRIALKAWRTNTDGSVKVHFTLSSGATDGGQARVNTLLRLASFV